MSRLDVQPELVCDLLVRFLREELGSAGFARGVVGLSGGVDSAVSAALAARALGSENTLAVLLPYRTSSPASEAHAKLVAESLGIPTRRVDISPMVDGYVERGAHGSSAVGAAHEPRGSTLGAAAGGTSIDAVREAAVIDARRRGNVMARCRMTVLYDLSVEWQGLVIGTSNKTEMLLGYSTQWGDAAHAVNPLGDLYKHQVYQLARYLELPREVIEKAPSADLVAGQTDEGDLGFTYAAADELLYRMVDERWTVDELVAGGFERDFVLRVARRVVQNQFKRVPPVIAKLSHRSINHDFRYLRDWGR